MNYALNSHAEWITILTHQTSWHIWIFYEALVPNLCSTAILGKRENVFSQLAWLPQRSSNDEWELVVGCCVCFLRLLPLMLFSLFPFLSFFCCCFVATAFSTLTILDVIVLQTWGTKKMCTRGEIRNRLDSTTKPRLTSATLWTRVSIIFVFREI